MKVFRFLLLLVGLIVFISGLTAMAQIPVESEKADTPKTISDSSITIQIDTTLSDTTLFDTTSLFIQQPDSTVTDSLSPELTAFDLPCEEEKVKIEFFHADDSISAYLLNERLAYSDQLDRSFHRDAADLVRFNPSNFIVEYQSTPLRKTLSPFCLPGNRINVILNNRTLNPFEHTFEPDNMIDFNDIPTAPVRYVYNVEGPLGMVFGAKNSTSSIILFPYNPDSTIAESKLLVDKGSFGYAYTKAIFANRYKSGQSIRLAVGYRKADGAYTYTDDDAYHQWGEIIYPLNKRIRLNLNGRLYRRDGSFIVQPDYLNNYYLYRFRRDRDISAGLDYAVSSNQKSSVEFRHQRSESAMNRQNIEYNRGFDIFDNSLIFSHEGKLGDNFFKARLLFSHEKYDESGRRVTQHCGLIDVSYLHGDSAAAWLLYLKADKVVGYEPAPSAALFYSKYGEKYYLSGSLGYSTKFPRLYELYLTDHAFRINSSATGSDYFESGDNNLKPEKQLVGNISFGWGKVGNDLLLSATGGKIFDGIDWQKSDNPPPDVAWSNNTVGIFRSKNNDIEFANITARQRLSWRDNLHFSGGASYHFMRIDGETDLPYSPDYQLFSNLELHLYIKYLDLHLYGYGEAIYNQPYYGYRNIELGENIILNGRLSFRVKKFRFFYIFQNVLASVYELREDYVIPGRYLTYGITWEFLD